jgi:hypothetical protein
MPMPWKVRKPLYDGAEVVARPGEILADDDPIALAAKPNQVTRVQPVAAMPFPDVHVAVSPEAVDEVLAGSSDEEWESDETPWEGDAGIDL